MKTLLTYISESQNNIDSILVKTKYNFGSNIQTISMSKTERADVAKEQEKIVCDILNSKNTDYTFTSIKDWCEAENISWSAKLDSIVGDIIVKDNSTNEIVCLIDLKVADKNTGDKYIGGPDALSLINFNKPTELKQIPDTVKKLYLCCKASGVAKVIDPKKLFDYEVGSKGKFLVSYNRKNTSNEVKSTFKTSKIYNAHIKDKTNKVLNDVNTIYDEDYVPTDVLSNL